MLTLFPSRSSPVTLQQSWETLPSRNGATRPRSWLGLEPGCQDGPTVPASALGSASGLLSA